MNAVTMFTLDDDQIDQVTGGLWFVPLVIMGVKAGLATSAGTSAAIAIGATIGAAAAAAGLASAAID